jgi:hypothetical protein
VPNLPITGGCLCGGVRFEIDQPLDNAGYCHCTRCQRRTGTAASPQARVPRGSLRLLQGEQLIRAYVPDEHGFAKLFCSTCGLTIEWHQYVAYAAPWEPLADDGVPRYPEARPR